MAAHIASSSESPAGRHAVESRGASVGATPSRSQPRGTGNLDPRTVEGFGEEWQRFTQRDLQGSEFERLFDRYFSIFPWDSLASAAVGFDLGCGSGRWARGVLPRVGHLHLIDPSGAIDVARRNLHDFDSRCTFHRATVESVDLAEGSMDFGYSLGVLHHVPDTCEALRAAVRLLKPGAPFLLYLYYALETRPWWYRAIWRVSDGFRWLVSRLPAAARHVVTDLIAACVYWPLARIARVGNRLGLDTRHFPLSAYAHTSFYTMRTDALDRLGTALESRFTAREIEEMMRRCGLDGIRFAAGPPYWVAVGTRAAPDRGG